MSVKRVRERVYAAAGRIDVPTLDVDAVVTRSAAGSRRRRRGRLVLAASAAVVVGVAGGVAWRSGVLQPADTSPAPATPEALAAVALEHIDSEPSSFELLYQPPKGTVGVDLRFHAGNGDDGNLVRVSAAPGRAPQRFCRYAAGCETIATDAGDVRLRWEEEVVGQEPGLFSLLLQTPDEYQVALYQGVGITGDPREQDLEISVDDLVDILTDERFALTTTQQMVDTRVEGFPRPDDDDPAATTPRVLAHEALEQLTLLKSLPEAETAYEIDPPAEYAGGDDIAARIEFADDVMVTVVLDRKPRPDILDCPAGWTCLGEKQLFGTDSRQQLAFGFTDGTARAVELRTDHAVVMQWDESGFTGDDRAELDQLFGNALITSDLRPRTIVRRVRDADRWDLWEDR